MIRATGYTLKDGKLVKAVTRNKFNAQKVTDESGNIFDSIYERQVYQERKLQEQAGEITNLELKPVFMLQEAFRDKAGKWHRAITWEADFSYIENGVKVAEDAKGFYVEISRIKHKLFARRYPDYVLRVTKKNKRR